MKSHEISRSKIGPFSLAYTDPYIGSESTNVVSYLDWYSHSISI